MESRLQGGYILPTQQNVLFTVESKLTSSCNSTSASCLPTPAIMIARKAGVSKQAVECYFSDNATEHYSNMDYSKVRLTRQRKNTKGAWHSSYGKNNLDNRL